MLSQPAWFHRLDEILSALRSMTSTQLDRLAVEKLFRVRQRRARQIMAGLEGLRVGNAAAVSREALHRAPGADGGQRDFPVGREPPRPRGGGPRPLEPTAGGVACAHSGCGGCLRTPPWGSFRLTGTNGSSEIRGGYYGNCLTPITRTRRAMLKLTILPCRSTTPARTLTSATWSWPGTCTPGPTTA